MSRSKKLELLDTGDYTAEEYEDCLEKLARVGQMPGGDRTTIKAMGNPTSVLDFGCGGGHFTAMVARAFPNAKVVGYDRDPEAIAHAKARFSAPNLEYRVDDPGTDFDLVTATLVLHHLTDDQIVDFFRKYKRVVVNDLHRSWFAYFLYLCTAPWLLRNRLITHDGLISIRRGFKRSDWKRYLGDRGKIKWKWAFRWVVCT